mmetsp:Transcript_18583/g.58777  ORF Transcript_18583/g.58777 Transcript_18583/m.58777 type:complete len:215 (-) Transcript_18583:401-1045(-)
MAHHSAEHAEGTRSLSCGLLRILDGPVEDVVVLVALAEEEVLEELPQVGVVGLIGKAQGAAVVEVDGKLVRVALAEHLHRGGHLLLGDHVVLLLFGGRLEALPGQAASEEVHEHIAKGLEVVTARLLDAQVSVDGRITRCACEVLVLAVGDVLVRLWVAVLLGEAKVDHVDLVGLAPEANEEVVRLDVAVDEALVVDVLHALQELLGDNEDGFG